MNLSQIQNYLQQHQLDGWLLYDFRGSNPVALHVAGLHTSGSRRWFLWIPAQGTPRWLIHAIEGSTFVKVNPDVKGEMTKYAGWKELEERLVEIVNSQRPNAAQNRPLRIAMEYSPLNAIPYVSRVDAGTKEMVEAATGAEIVTSADLVQMVQAVLSDHQVDTHRRAATICLDAKDRAFSFIRSCLLNNESVNEYQVQQLIMEHLNENGMLADHGCIVSVNSNAADPHYGPSADRYRPIQKGDMVLIDLWAKDRHDPDACFADITWTAYCGSEVPATAKRIFDTVAMARDATVTFIQERLDAGQPVYGYEVDDVAREVITDAGFGEAFFHRTGHSLGTTGHFNGVNIDNLETQDRRQLIPGVMFTIEPGIYLPDFNFDDSSTAKGIGIRSEINCLMHEGRVEVTTLPMQAEVIALL
ncbi:MAG: M24 family metallopeptidase [Caldilineaceae bacterium]